MNFRRTWGNGYARARASARRYPSRKDFWSRCIRTGRERTRSPCEIHRIPSFLPCDLARPRAAAAARAHPDFKIRLRPVKIGPASCVCARRNPLTPPSRTHVPFVTVGICLTANEQSSVALLARNFTCAHHRHPYCARDRSFP